MAFVLLNKLNGDADTELGRIPKGGKLTVAYVPESIRKSIAAGNLECTPPVSTTFENARLKTSTGTAAADGQIVAAANQAGSDANNATLVAIINKLSADVASLRAEMDNNRQQMA